MLLPPPTAQNYSLRNRPHNRQLPDRISRITDCNFTVRMLYHNMYWHLNILDLRFVLFLCTTAVWQFINTTVHFDETIHTSRLFNAWWHTVMLLTGVQRRRSVSCLCSRWKEWRYVRVRPLLASSLASSVSYGNVQYHSNVALFRIRLKPVMFRLFVSSDTLCTLSPSSSSSSSLLSHIKTYS